MSKKFTNQDIKELSEQYDIEEAMIKSLISVESSGTGFSNRTGKMIIQFEPKYFFKFQPDAPRTVWYSNKIDVQSKEWDAFESASKINKADAIKSTSLGLMQVMGSHYKSLEFKNPQEMFDYALISERNQLDIALRFIRSNNPLYEAVKALDFDKIAYYYNGANYKKLARRLKIKPYNEKLEFFYNKYK